MMLLDDALQSSRPLHRNTLITEVAGGFCARLPSYREQQRACLLAHCLPTVLQSIVAAYAEPTREDTSGPTG
jgi:hypothetical protein